MNIKDADLISDMIVAAFERAMPPLNARIRALEAENVELTSRIVALEQRPELKFLGPWKAEQSYPQNAIVQRASALWIATEASNGSAAPGTAEGSGFWKLVVKSIER